MRAGEGFGDDEGDLLAHVTDPAARQHRPRRGDHLLPALLRHVGHAGQRAEPGRLDIGGRVDAEHAWRALGRRRVDATDLGVRVRRAQHDGVGLIVERDVVGIPAATGQKTCVLDPFDGLSDAEFAHAGMPRATVAAIIGNGRGALKP